MNNKIPNTKVKQNSLVTLLRSQSQQLVRTSESYEQHKNNYLQKSLTRSL